MSKEEAKNLGGNIFVIAMAILLFVALISV